MKATIYIHTRGMSLNGEPMYQIFTFDASAHGDYTLVCKQEIELEIPADFNPVAAEIAGIEKRLDAAQDEYLRKVQQLKDRIASLRCIENGVAV